MDTLLVPAERRYQSINCKTNPQPGKKFTFIQNNNKRHGPFHGSGNWTNQNDDNGAMMSTPNLTPEKSFDGAIRVNPTLVKIDPLSEGTTRTNTITDTMTTEKDQLTKRSEVNPGTGALTKVIRDRLHRRGENHASRISADNPELIQLNLWCLTNLENNI